MAGPAQSSTIAKLVFAGGLVLFAIAVRGLLVAPAWQGDRPREAGAPLTLEVRDAAEPGECRGGAMPARAAVGPHMWVTADDYPPRAQRLGQQGTVAIAFTIGADGRVPECRITQSSGVAELDAISCTLIKRRARYHPARDSAGCPTTEQAKTRFRWVLPEG